MKFAGLAVHFFYSARQSGASLSLKNQMLCRKARSSTRTEATMRRRRQTLNRGRTRKGRIELLDRLFEANFFELPEQGHAVDLGYGDSPVTTLDWATALSSGAHRFKVIGVETDASRVRRAVKEFEADGIYFYQGGFDLGLLGLESIAVIRCMNVLRGYPLESVKSAQIAMLKSLVPGGLLLEGSTDTEGHLLTAHLWRRSEQSATYEGLLMATDFRRGFSPRMFRDVLPRDLRRHVKPGEPVFEFLEHFETLTNEMRGNHETLLQLFVAAGRRLEAERTDTLGGTLLAQGVIRWRPENPSWRREVLQSSLVLDSVDPRVGADRELGTR